MVLETQFNTSSNALSPRNDDYRQGSTTFQGYDSTNPHPNPRLREVVMTDPSLAAKYSLGAE